MEWELDLDMAWAKVELMMMSARTVTWEGFLNAPVAVLLALAGEFILRILISVIAFILKFTRPPSEWKVYPLLQPAETSTVRIC